MKPNSKGEAMNIKKPTMGLIAVAFIALGFGTANALQVSASSLKMTRLCMQEHLSLRLTSSLT